MDESLIDAESLPIERKSILPGEGFFRPDDVTQAQQEQEVADSVADTDTVVVADPDADGLACVALVREVHEDAALVPASPHELDRRLAWTTEYVGPGTDVFVCDLCPDRESDLEPLPALADQAGEIRWFDHHQWNDGLAATVREAGVDLVVGESDEECSADVAMRELEGDFDERLVDLVAVTRDHDLWIREDPRSDDLADFSHWSEPEEYLEVISEHGADLSPEVEEFLAEKRIEKEALIAKAVERAELREIGPWTIGVTYGRCSQNEVAEALREQGADAAVIVKPAGSASLRGTETFERCHEVAEQVNGGGHPRAAGCKPDIYDDMLDYAHHWTTRGAVAKQAIVDAFRRLEPDDGSESTGEGV
ncbi:MAG: recombinase RecJ [Halapricum sp.]